MAEIDSIRLPSRFDYAFHKQLNDSYTPILDDPSNKELVLDFTQVEYLDSSALGMMVLLQKKFSGKSRKVTIKGAKGATKEILIMANMQKIFEFV